MALKIKQNLAKNIYDTIQNKLTIGCYNELFGCFNLVRSKENNYFWKVHLPLKPNVELDLKDFQNNQSEVLEDKSVKSLLYQDNTCLHVELDMKNFIKNVLESDPTRLECKKHPKKLIVEYSSPNIAKPFHVGHLRSTIVGNYLTNIKRKVGENVMSMNYLGDWGTQFGLIQVGVEIENYTDEDLEKDPVTLLYKAYVKGNREAEKNPDLYDKAKQIFSDLESGNESITQKWSRYRDWTIKELSKMYERLGVSFDEYSGESFYKSSEAGQVLKMLDNKGILCVDEKNRKVANIGEKPIPLVKSDGASLYVLRDLMAVMDRRSKHKIDEMYYVVENGQNEHFNALFSLCSELNLNEGVKLEHVKLGRIHGMSTRKGRLVFLTDILDEARERVYQRQLESNTTKVGLESKNTADIVGVSAVIVNDLKYHRKRDYEFSWENILQMNGKTGVHLQYCHCRLFNVNKNSGVVAASECDPEALLEPEAVQLICEIARFEEVVLQSEKEKESCILIDYLFRLTKCINLAFKSLRVKDSGEHVGSQRLLMFNKSREVLADGLKLLGLKLLTSM